MNACRYLLALGMLLAVAPPAVAVTMDDLFPEAVRCDVRFDLNDTQAEEVSRLRLFRPTAAQLAVLRAIDPDAAVLYRVVTHTFECGCGRHAEVEWVGEREVAVTRISRYERSVKSTYVSLAEQDSLIWDDLAMARAEPALADTSAVFVAARERSEALIMSETDEFYYRGEPVERYRLSGIFAQHAARAAADSTVEARLILQLPPTWASDQDRLLWEIKDLTEEAIRGGVVLLLGE